MIGCVPWALRFLTGLPISSITVALNNRSGLAEDAAPNGYPPAAARNVLELFGYRAVMCRGRHPDGEMMFVHEAAAKTSNLDALIYISAIVEDRNGPTAHGHAMIGHVGLIFDNANPHGVEPQHHEFANYCVRSVILLE